MIIGVPRERKQGERRVAVVPAGVHRLASRGHTILIEKSAGQLSGITDDEFRAAGAEIVETLEDAWTRCELLIKVKEPAPEEIKFFRPGLVVFSFLHLAAQGALASQMASAGVTGIDYDLVELDDRSLPILQPMSVIAGKLAVQAGATALQASEQGGKGVLLGGVPGVQPGKVLVLGAGNAGTAAVQVALGMGADVTVVDRSEVRLIPLRAFGAKTHKIDPTIVAESLSSADLVIGAALIPGALAPKLITRDNLKSMSPGSVIVDISIDQGGVCESSRSTSIAEPTYVEEKIIHYCVPNMPALVPRTSTFALTSASFPWLMELADKGVEQAIIGSMPLKRSITSYKGQVTNKAIADALNMEFKDLDQLFNG